MNIYTSKTALVKRFFHKDDCLSLRCIVCFTGGHTYTLDTSNKKIKLLLDAGFDVVYIQSSLNDYHQTLPLSFIQDLSLTLNKEYTELLGYGHSMGGYAALAFSQFFNYSSILVFSPYYSIIEKFDKRFAKHAKSIDWKYHVRGCGAHFHGKIFIVHDPVIQGRNVMDRLHYEKVEAEFVQADVIPVSIPFSGHPPDLWLKDAGIYKTFVLSILNDGVVLDLRFKKYRVNNLTYLTTLGRHLLTKKNKNKSAMYVLNLAIESGDIRHGTHKALSLVHAAEKNYTKAVESARFSVKVVNDAMVAAKSDLIANNYMKYRSANEKNLSKMLRKSCQFEEALRVINLAYKRNPKKHTLLVEKIHVLLSMTVFFLKKNYYLKRLLNNRS